jgi:Cysteine-rich secretory protein family
MKLARGIPALTLVISITGLWQGPRLLAASTSHSGKLTLHAPAGSAPWREDWPAPATPTDPVKRAVFQKINEDRVRAGLAPVAWDDAVSRVADEFCARQVAERTRGHFLMDGIPPYARTGFAGIFGKGAENSVSWLTSASSFTEPSVALALSGHRDMMSEEPPADGHRRTILNPEMTHVGVGYAVDHGRFQMAQEFLVRGLERLSFRVSNEAHPSAMFEGQPRSHRVVRFVTIAWEASPRFITREEANSRITYAYPKPFLAYVPEGEIRVHVSDTQTQDRLQVRRDGSFSFAFSPPEPGLYTFLLYTSMKEGPEPRPSGSATLWFD